MQELRTLHLQKSLQQSNFKTTSFLLISSRLFVSVHQLFASIESEKSKNKILLKSKK